MACPPDRHDRDATRHLGVTRSAADLVPELQRRIEQLEQALLEIREGDHEYGWETRMIAERVLIEMDGARKEK